MSDSQEPAVVAPAVKRQRRKSLQSGFSLLARGEPQIWFTGGMLILCLAMIFGLVGLIVVSGLPTFWPKRLDIIVLNDGTLEIGQPQKMQVRSENSQTADTSESPEKNTKPSRYYRTDNADLTGRHFRWIDPAEANAAGIAAPEWAMVVERIAWGRLNGIPVGLSEQIPLPADTLENQAAIAEAIRLLSAVPGDDRAELDPRVLETLEINQVAQRSQELWKQIGTLRSSGSDNATIQVLTDDSGWQLATQMEASATIREARLLVTEPRNLLARLQSAITRTTGLRHEIDAIRLEISRLDARISKLRAGVRRAELATETSVAQQVEQSHYLLEQLELLGRSDQELLTLVETVEEQFAGDPQTAQAAVGWIDQYRTEGVPLQIAALENQLNEWLTPIRLQPAEIVQAVNNYQAEFRSIVAAKLPLQQELERLESRIAVGNVTFAVPVGGTKLDGLPANSVAALVAGRVEEAVRAQLESMSIDVASVLPSKLNDELVLVTVSDTQGKKHLLAVTSPGYVSGDSTAEEVFLLPEKVHACHEIVRAVAVNQISLSGKVSVYWDRWREFITENPRENIHGGVFPAIWGTVVMTLIMTIAVVPFGVMAALYLREYTKAGPLVSLIRISINNLAGVPSIVYGVFGFSFFCYLIGAFIDGGPKNADIVPLPSIAWFLAMGATAVTGTSAFLLSFFGSGPSHTQTARKRWMSKAALFLWLFSIAAMAYLILKSPFFDGFYREYLPNPTFGKGGILWAALTLSLLTLPVVIVATEEALAAVPNSLREGSLACGASKWQTIRRIVLPHARPGILTGAILAMARGAGEVAPLMLVGALPSAPDLPLDGEFPYFHGSRSFMHLGYQIYTLGFQSPNSEAAKPMVFTCTLLLILIVATLNVSAIYLRARLKKRFHGSQF